VVREFTAADIAELNEVRSAFEVLAFRLAAQRRTAEGLERLRADLDAEFDAAREGDAVRSRRAAADFHETVIAIAANAQLSEIERLLRSKMRWLLVQHSDLLGVAHEHEALYAAIASGDAARAEELAAAHVAADWGAAR
jgi:DNA-binding GntR family transcriptional regulator